MKATLVMFLIGVCVLDSYSQTQYFKSDTLGYKKDSLTSDISYLLGEKWYLSKISNNGDTIIFNKDYLKHKAKFEFDQTGTCYVEAGWMECGKYGMDFLLKYKINNNKLAIFGPDSIFFKEMNGDLTIDQYNKNRMVLIRKK